MGRKCTSELRSVAACSAHFGFRCLGRAFAVTNIKVLMATLIRRFTFELPGGPVPKVVMKQTIVQRPALEGGDGFAIPVVVQRVVE
jgi:hypothetical protein